MKRRAALALLLALLAALGPLAARADGIALRNVLGQWHFVREDTGALFVPRGMNYVRLDDYVVPIQDTFDPATYDPCAVETALRQMELSGYNVVRITLDSRYLIWDGQNLRGPGIATDFADILTDFLQRAQYHGLRVVLALRFVPNNYRGLWPPSPWNITGDNREIFNSTYARVRARVWTDLLAAIPGWLRGAIFALDIYDEAYASSTDAPFVGVGWFVFGGVPYRMFVPADRQALLDAATVPWANSIIAAIKQVDPDMLVSVSIGSPVQVGHPGYDGVNSSVGNNNEYPLRLTALARSNVDFVDMHFYPLGVGYDSAGDFDSVELNPAVVLGKPLIMSEFGMVRALYPDPVEARASLLVHLATSCRYGFAGWILWDWDTTERGDLWWAAMQDDQALNNELAPVLRPRICAPIPAGDAIVSINGAGMIVASDGRSWCAFDSWQHFLDITGLDGPHAAAYAATLQRYTRVPPEMHYNGICGAK